jgi:hypothetical protein
MWQRSNGFIKTTFKNKLSDTTCLWKIAVVQQQNLFKVYRLRKSEVGFIREHKLFRNYQALTGHFFHMQTNTILDWSLAGVKIRVVKKRRQNVYMLSVQEYKLNAL